MTLSRWLPFYGNALLSYLSPPPYALEWQTCEPEVNADCGSCLHTESPWQPGTLPRNRILLGTGKMPKGLLKIHGRGGERKNPWNFLTTVNGYKGLRYRLKAEVTQIKPQPWPFKNCLPLLEISSFIDKDDFWSIVKLVANVRQPSRTARCSAGPLLFWRGWRSAESHQCRIDQRSWKMPMFTAPRAVGLRPQPPAGSAAPAHAAEHAVLPAKVTSLHSAQLFLQFSINS